VEQTGYTDSTVQPSKLNKTLAISIRKIDFSETSQVIRLYTQNRGKISCIAKGSKRLKSPFLGAIDLFVLYEVVNLDKSPASLDILTSAVPLKSYSNIRRDIRYYYGASYLCQFVDELTIEGQENPGLFEEFKSTLESLDMGKDLFSGVTNFELRALRILGYFPRLNQCGYCKEQITGQKAYFSARDGGAICLKCRTKGPVPMLVNTSVLNHLNAENLEILDIERQEIRDILDYHLTNITGKKLLTISRYLY
jgi:DNA repair protein RecO (recombination protein O)